MAEGQASVSGQPPCSPSPAPASSSELKSPGGAAPQCRICQLSDLHEPLISPCMCKGSLAYVHFSCLARWLNAACRSYCELCQYHFKTVETRRYRVCRALRMWVTHPRNWPNIRANLIMLFLLTLFTAGLSLMFLMGLNHFISEGQRVGIPSLWTTVVVGAFLSLVCLVYLMTVIWFFRDQLTPWYHWWTRCVNVRLLLEPNQMVMATQKPLLTDRDSEKQSSESACAGLPGNDLGVYSNITVVEMLEQGSWHKRRTGKAAIGFGPSPLSSYNNNNNMTECGANTG